MKRWIIAARPKTLLASIAPVAIGTALAVYDGQFHLPSALACLVGAIAIQTGTNFCNDYFDFVQGADTSTRKGPTRAVAAGLITPRAMLLAAAIVFVLALAIGGFLFLRAGWPLAVIAMVSVICGVWYTAGRFSLAYLGLAEIFVLVFFGPVAVAGTYYVQTLRLSWPIVVAGFAPGLLSMGLLVVNNLRDIDEDRAAGKRTLAVRLGAEFTRWEYATCVVGAFSIPIFLWLVWNFRATILIASIPVFGAIPFCVAVWSARAAQLNGVLAKTASLLFFYALLFCLGLSWL